ncbi:MAG: hypothetical protein U0350_32480 [Caldilineaceae bacterium]
MSVNQGCQFDDATLLDYVRNAVPADVRRTIEASPDCVQAARRLADEMRVLTPLLRETVCPEIDTLIDYQEGRIKGTQRLVVYQHVQQCKQCQAELAMFGAIDNVPNVEQPAFFRRVVEAFFQAPTLSPVAVRGGGFYRTQVRTPQVNLLLRTSQATGKPRTWTLYGQLRADDETPLIQPERIVLQALDKPDNPEIDAVVEAHGVFTRKGLAAGRYALRVIMPDEEILIRELKVGDEF